MNSSNNRKRKTIILTTISSIIFMILCIIICIFIKNRSRKIKEYIKIGASEIEKIEIIIKYGDNQGTYEVTDVDSFYSELINIKVSSCKALKLATEKAVYIYTTNHSTIMIDMHRLNKDGKNYYYKTDNKITDLINTYLKNNYNI